MQEHGTVGSALQRYLKERGCALEGADARRLTVSLIDLICDDLIVAKPGAATSNRGPSNPPKAS